MIVLAQTSDKIQVVLAGAVATNQLHCVSAYRDITTSAYTPGNTAVNTNNTTDVDLVPAPAASTQRVVDFLSIYNADTDDRTVTIKIDVTGTEYILWKDTLSPGDTVRYIDGAGFSVFRTYQSIKSFAVHADAGVNFTMTNATLLEQLAGNTSRHVFMVDLEGYTQVRLRANQQVTSASVNTPLFRAKYHTSYTTTVATFTQLGLSGQVEFSLTGVGYKDTGWVPLALAARTSGICIGFLAVGGDAVADPALGATDILFR